MFAKSCSLLLLCFFASVCCDVTVPGPCPEVPVPPNFSWEKLQGSWYVIKETKEEDGLCPVDTYIVRDDKTITYLRGFRLHGYKRGTGGPGFINETQPNKITIKYNPNGETFDRYVVASDYKNYAALIGCVKDKSNHKINARVITKSLNPPPEAKLAAYIALQNLGVPATSLIVNFDKYSYCNETL